MTGFIRLGRLMKDVVDGPFGSHLTSAHYQESGARVVRLGNIGAGHFKDEPAAFIGLDHFEELRRHEVSHGDVLVAGLGDDQNSVGRACMTPPDLGPALVKADCFRFRVREGYDSRYVMWMLNSAATAGAVRSAARGSTRQRATPEGICSIYVPEPPPLDDQRRVACFLDDQIAVLDRRRHLFVREAKLQNERVEALISQEVLPSLSGSSRDMLPMKRLVEKLRREASPDAPMVTAFRDGQVTARTKRRAEGDCQRVCVSARPVDDVRPGLGDRET